MPTESINIASKNGMEFVPEMISKIQKKNSFIAMKEDGTSASGLKWILDEANTSTKSSQKAYNGPFEAVR